MPPAKRWLKVPIGFNANQNTVRSEIFCKNVPIVHQQGEEHSCLFSSIASAFEYMGCKCAAQHIVANRYNLIGKDANTQWMGLRTLLEQKEQIGEEMHFKMYNQARGSKSRQRHTLDVETLTRHHHDYLKVHAVLLVGANGKRDHAVAVVNGMIFDSSATYAMHLCPEALDWCCNCNGYGKTGKAMQITIKRCKFEARCWARVSAPTAADWLRAGYTYD